MNRTNLYKDKNVKNNILLKLKVGIIGFGNQGRAQALNLKDSGVDVFVGLRKKSLNKNIALEQGLKVCEISEIVIKCDIICFLIPDEQIPIVYNKQIKKNLKKGQTLLFSHGYAVHFNHISIPLYVNVILVAPSGSGKKVRNEYLADSGVPNLIAIYQDFTKNALEITLSYSKSIGGTKLGAFLTTFEEETVTDLFGEQILLTGSIPRLMKESFNVLVDNGYSQEIAWLVCYFEVKSIVDSFHKEGFNYLNNIVSNIAEYGGATRGRRLIDKNVNKKMQQILDEIKSGSFEKEWKNEKENNFRILNKERKINKVSKIEKVTLKMKEIFFKKK